MFVNEDGSTFNTTYDSISHQANSSVTGLINDKSGDHDEHKMKRHLRLFDLVCIGIGSTVGSGIFIISGVVASSMAGPAGAISWAISGTSAFFSGCCYAEMAGRIPSEGSSYAYVYYTMGELPAILAALCLTFEYLVASAIIANSWGDKFIDWINIKRDVDSSSYLIDWIMNVLDPPEFFHIQFNTCAFLAGTASVALLLKGVKESKVATNVFTSFKIGVVLFMVTGGFFLFQSENMNPFIPKEFGFRGVMRGATTSFFGYLGFDEVCCLGGEAINPEKNMPRAIMIVLLFVTSLYIAAAISLTGMQPYDEISSTTGFASAFIYNGHVWAADICAYGELISLPVVCMITVMAHPRLQLAMAEDGLFPRRFGEVDTKGNLTNGIWLCGTVMIIIASIVPFDLIDDATSSAVLVVYSFTNSSLILLRYSAPPRQPLLLNKLLVAYNVMCYLSALLWTNLSNTTWGTFFACGATLAAFLICLSIYLTCSEKSQMLDNKFRTPFLPFFPCLGMYVNWYLVAQLSWVGNLILLCTSILSVGCYLFSKGTKNAFTNRYKR